MNSFDSILSLLYKRVPVQSVIEQRIKFNSFSKTEFLNLADAYVPHRTENEASNMYNYLISICSREVFRDGRTGSSAALNVFELLLFVSGRYLDITNNVIRCRYQKLPDWRKLTVELSEDLFVTAFLASKLTRESVMRRGFTWPRIIGHDNEHLHAVMKRGISENHSHLMGAAPIFHISWLSLMNNIANPAFAQIFHKYDINRRYTNVKYSGEYEELPFYFRYLQAGLIRFVLFSRLNRRRINVGSYAVDARDILTYLRMPELFEGASEQKITNEILQELRNRLMRLTECRYIDLIGLLVEVCQGKKYSGEALNEKSPLWLFFANNPVGEQKINQLETEKLLEIFVGKTFQYAAENLFILLKTVNLEYVETLFEDRQIYADRWEQMTLQNVYEMIRNPKRIEMCLGSIQSMIDVMRREAQHMVSATLGSVDYALGPLKYDQMKEEDPNFIFAGERLLMYQMFEEIKLPRGRMDEQGINLFYAYILIKESIRSEMIQSNLNVGFANFQRYQSRKMDFLVNDIYNNVFIKSAVHDSLLSNNVRHMELRFAPLNTVEGNLSMISQMDQTMGYRDQEGHLVKERFFYTLHFIKRGEELRSPMDYYYCRHYRRREQVMRAAGAVAEIRERYPLIGKRIFGIDAASSEIGCRPEVFAPAFRYLKAHRRMYRTTEGLQKLPQLRATYHVGEDFLDIADGLRAIDEAVRFLNLGYGDRLGHALALGINIKQWYEQKEYKIVLPEQDYLDNLVWIYHKLGEYGISGYENLKDWILDEFTVVFGRLYRSIDDSVRVDINNYYNAWKLRGDDPSLYENGHFDKRRMEYHRQPYLVNEIYPEAYEIRELKDISDLYYRYHFDERSRRLGNVTTEYTMTKGYVSALTEIQHAMQFDIASRGLAIETNPSSNYHIGTFRSYDDHPIVHFFNKGLVHDEEKLRACAQIPVSINTDDQGIFNTSLENEYALLASSLEAVTDDRDRKIYRPSDIYEWLDNIRIMGNDHNFAEMYRENRPEEGRRRENK